MGPEMPCGLYFDVYLNQLRSGTDSDNGLVRNRRQTIVWIDYGLVYWRIYVAHGLNQLIYSPCLIYMLDNFYDYDFYRLSNEMFPFSNLSDNTWPYVFFTII